MAVAYQDAVLISSWHLLVALRPCFPAWWRVRPSISSLSNRSRPLYGSPGRLKNAGAIVDPARGFVVGGISAGGAAAAVIGAIPGAISAGVEDFIGLTALQNPITGIFSGIPFLVTEAMLPAQYRDIFKSRDENKSADSRALKDLESRLDVHSPWFSPINLNLSDFKTVRNHPPKVFIYSGRLDQFHDDSTIYAKWLSQLEGVQVKASVLEEEGHMGWLTPPWPAAHSRKMKETTLDGMAWLLDLEWDRNQDLPI